MTRNPGRWPTGAFVIENLIRAHQLERVPGNPVYTAHLIERAARKLRSAKAIVEDDPEDAYLLAYDAARFALTALLAAQGLRAKGGAEGGHLTVQDAIEAQFPGTFPFFKRMRRIRNSLEYPTLTEQAPTVTGADSVERIAQVENALEPVTRLVGELYLF